MWHESYREYVERHFRFYFDIPEEISFFHGEVLEWDRGIGVSALGRGFFDSGEEFPAFEMVKELPVLFKEPGSPLIIKENGQIKVTADLFAAIFYLMSGWQERQSPRRDDRFYASDSWQGRHGFEKMALADFYFETLAEAVSQHTGRPVERKSFFENQNAVFLSHDIDKMLSGRWEGSFNELKKFRWGKALMGVFSRKDPWFNLRQIADLEAKLQVKSTFFILPEKGEHPLGTNADYQVESPMLQQELKYLRRKGMEIALHGSLGSHLSAKQLQQERDKIDSEVRGNRFHFLKFKTEISCQLLQEAKLQYDASMGFPDRVGFRNGISSPFKLFDFRANKTSDVVEIPLHAMDTTLHHSKYMNLNPNTALQEILSLHAEVTRHRGVFSLLWHNNYFSDYKYGGWSAVYEDFVKRVSSGSRFMTASELTDIYSGI